MRTSDPNLFLNEILIRLKSTPRLGSGTSTFINPHSYRLLRKEPGILDSIDNVYVDGSLLVRCFKFFGISVERVSLDMTSLAGPILARCSENQIPLDLVGGTPGTAQAAARVFSDAFPGLKVRVVAAGYFPSEQDRQELIGDLVARPSGVLLVGMGAVHQERFLADLRSAGWSGEGYTCGGFLHQTALGTVNYYPDWVDRLGLRWLYRIFDEPILIKRYLFLYPPAVAAFIFDAIAARTMRRR